METTTRAQHTPGLEAAIAYYVRPDIDVAERDLLLAKAHKLESDNAALLAALELAYARLQRKANTCRDSEWKAADQDAFDAAKAALAQARGDA